MKVPRSLIIILALLLCLATGLQPRELSNARGMVRRTVAPVKVRAGGAQTHEDTVREALELLTLSERQNLDDHALALQTAQQALALLQTTADNADIARAYAHVGQYYLTRSDFPESIQNYQQALRLWRDLNEPEEQAEILIMLGIIDARKGEWQSSISLLTEAQRLVEENYNPFKMGQIAGTLAYVFNESGLPENGLIQYQRALDFFRQTPDAHDDARMLLTLGNTYYLLGNYSEALNQLQQALTSPDLNSLDIAQCHEYLGKVYSARNEYDVALPHLQFALAAHIRIGNPNEEAQVRAMIGHIYQQQGQLERAQTYYKQALETFIKLSDRINQAAVYYALGQSELKAGKYDDAEGYLRQSIEVTENIRRVSTNRDLTAAFSASVYERYEKYIECLMRKYEAHPAQGLVVRAFEASELARARSLAELLRATGTNLVPGLDPQLAEKEKSLRQSLRMKEDYKVTLLSREKYQAEELTALDAELSRLEAEYKQVTETIQARYPSYKQITRPVAWDVQQIQEQVIFDDQTVLLEYSLGEAKSYVWAVTRNSIKSYELPARALIEEAAQKLYNLMATPPGAETENDLNSAARELGRMVLSPVAPELKKRRVIIVADGALNYIPFQVLPAPSTNNGLLADNCEIINVPSASILGELRQEAARRQPAEKVLMAFGAPVFESNYAQRRDTNGNEQLAAVQAPETEHLRYALRDIELKGDSFDPSAIKPLFYDRRELANLLTVTAGGGETFMATDFDASRERLLSMDLTKFAILHFATHGLLDPKRPERSGLILSTVNREGRAQNGFVGLQDIYSLRAPVDLVVLSACRTGLGKDMRGEGLVGLTRGFMYAGASSVVASLWKVDDEATAELMKQFYTNMLHKGMTPAEALRAAQNSIRQKPEWRSPYYWAAFTLQGEYRQVINPRRAAGAMPLNSKIIVGGVLLALLAGGAWHRHRRLRTA
jgi:CHAT domain-containing protein/predicted negative regulator of RcsB-dependent stress response